MNDRAESAREVTLHNGVIMPTLAFGCAFGDWVGATEFQGFLPEQAWRAVSLALDGGYRAFDGARAYGTERIVGTLLGQRFASGELTREELFITTKLAHPAAPPHVNILTTSMIRSGPTPDSITSTPRMSTRCAVTSTPAKDFTTSGVSMLRWMSSKA